MAGGYQFFRFLEHGGANMPTGWGVSFAVGKDWIKAVGDIAGNYKDGVRVHTFQGGLEFSGKGTRVVITPEGGVKIMANDRVGVQASVGFPILMDDGVTESTMRFFVGIVIRK